jgi:SnoaL-like protein
LASWVRDFTSSLRKTLRRWYSTVLGLMNYVLGGREALTSVFADLNRYEATTHFNGQSTVTIDGDRATGESYTIAHHLFSEDGSRKIMIASLRYLDTFAKIDGSWYFAERKLLLDWSETRPSTPGT